MEAGRALGQGPKWPSLLVECTSDLLFEADGVGVITWLSGDAEAVIGLPGDEVLGRPLMYVLPDGAAASVESLVAGVSDSHDGRSRFRLVSSTGEERLAGLLLRIARDEAGTVVGYAGSWCHLHDAPVVEGDPSGGSAVDRGSMFMNVPDPATMLGPVHDASGHVVDFRILDANLAACAFLGANHEELTSCLLLGSGEPGPLATYFEDFVTAMATGQPLALDGISMVGNGAGDADLYFDLRAAKVGDGITCTWREVTDRVQALTRLAASEQHYRLLAENAHDIVVLVRNGLIDWISPSVEALTGIPAERWIGQVAGSTVLAADAGTAERTLTSSGHDLPATSRVRITLPSGEVHWVEVSTRQYMDQHGKADGLISSIRVVDDVVRAEEALNHAASHDALTGLLNRSEALSRLNSITSHAPRTGQGTAVLFCDLDGLKAINDVHGHGFGDEVLMAVSSRIGECLRRDDYAARLGGDEIIVVLSGVHDLAEATKVAEKIRVGVARPLDGNPGASVHPTVSIGVTLCTPGEPVESLLARADEAMYRAKRGGRNSVTAI